MMLFMSDFYLFIIVIIPNFESGEGSPQTVLPPEAKAASWWRAGRRLCCVEERHGRRTSCLRQIKRLIDEMKEGVTMTCSSFFFLFTVSVYMFLRLLNAHLSRFLLICFLNQGHKKTLPSILSFLLCRVNILYWIVFSVLALFTAALPLFLRILLGF